MHTHHINLPVCGREREKSSCKGQSKTLVHFSLHITADLCSLLFPFVNFILSPWETQVRNLVVLQGRVMTACASCSPQQWRSDPGLEGCWMDKVSSAEHGPALPAVLWKFLVLSSPRKKGLDVCEPEEGENYLRGPTGMVKIL